VLSVPYEALDHFYSLISEVFAVHGLVGLEQLNCVGILLISGNTNACLFRLVGGLFVAISADSTIASDALLQVVWVLFVPTENEAS